MALLLGGCAKAPQAGGPAGGFPPPDVEVAAVAAEDVPIHSEWVATLDGSVNAQIQPQVSGYLVRQSYREGSYVRKDDVLFTIDARPFQAVLDQARGQLAQAESQVVQAESQVTQAEAQRKKASLDVDRDTPLVKARAIAQSQLDTELQALAAAEAAVRTAQAAVSVARAQVRAQQAAVAQAELNVGFTSVRSLVDGVAGVAQVQIGNLVNPGSVLTTVSQVDPIRVYFPISEQEYLRFAGEGKGEMLSAARRVPLALILTTGETYPHKGQVIFADRQVDPQTGTIRIAAAFPNPGNVLRPGQFGRIRALTATKAQALLVPQRAVAELQGQHQVAVVGADNKVAIRKVKTGPLVGSRIVLESGVAAGDRVITEGGAKVAEGMTVKPKMTEPRGAQGG